MRVRPDSVFVSSILHTIALLFFLRPAMWYYGAGAGSQGEGYVEHAFGVACPAIILIGLIVVWTGYVKRSRPAWFLMFVIVWFWAFPVIIRPIVTHLARGEFKTLPEFLYDAVAGTGMNAYLARSILVFLIMVAGLALPLGRFFIATKANEPAHLPSRRLVIPLLIGIPVAALALYGWLRVGFLYEIPAAQLNTFMELPPPPPPPTACRCPDGN